MPRGREGQGKSTSRRRGNGRGEKTTSPSSNPENRSDLSNMVISSNKEYAITWRARRSSGSRGRSSSNNNPGHRRRGPHNGYTNKCNNNRRSGRGSGRLVV